MKKSRLRYRGVSENSVLKEQIQELLRQIVIIRDKGCIFQKEKGHICTGYANDGHLILQADHLISRSNSDTYADPRLVVCVCKGIHGWKSVGSNLRKKEYDERVKKLLPKETVKLWEKCEADSWKPKRTGNYDWKLAVVALTNQLNKILNER